MKLSEMNLKPVDNVGEKSAVVAAENYDAARKVLTLQFTTGKVYEYSSFEPHQYREFVAAPSKGKWLGQNLRGADAVKRHPFSQITPEPES